MSDPFLDAHSFPWWRPEAFRLYEALVEAVRQPKEIDVLYKRSAPRLPALTLSGAPGSIWIEALENVASHGALRRFCELCQQHGAVAVREASIAMQQAATDAEPEPEAPELDREADQPPAPEAGRRAEPFRVVDDNHVPAAVLSFHERRLQALADALARVTPMAFRDPRISVELLQTANDALLSIDPLLEVLGAAAEEETRQPMRYELQQLDQTLREHRQAVADRLSDLDRVRSERVATQLCDDLHGEAAGLIAAGAETIRHLT